MSTVINIWNKLDEKTVAEFLQYQLTAVEDDDKSYVDRSFLSLVLCLNCLQADAVEHFNHR